MTIEDAVRYTVAAYTHRVDTGRIDDLLDLFSPEAVIEIVGAARHEGTEAIAAMFGRGVEHLGRTAETPRIRHHVASQLIEVDSETEARSSCYWTAIVGDLGVQLEIAMGGSERSLKNQESHGLGDCLQFWLFSIAAAIPVSAAFFSSVLARASTRAARCAASPRPCI